MSEATSLPVYIQISEMLMREIIAGRLSDGERLLPERDLAKSLNISVGTLRKSLKELEQKGALFRRHGSGNYVKFNTKFMCRFIWSTQYCHRYYYRWCNRSYRKWY